MKIMDFGFYDALFDCAAELVGPPAPNYGADSFILDFSTNKSIFAYDIFHFCFTYISFWWSFPIPVFFTIVDKIAHSANVFMCHHRSEIFYLFLIMLSKVELKTLLRVFGQSVRCSSSLFLQPFVTTLILVIFSLNLLLILHNIIRKQFRPRLN